MELGFLDKNCYNNQCSAGEDEAGDNSDGDTPVPIPNTAVKPVRADGTNAQLGVGRVGRCRSRLLLRDEKN